MRYDIVHMGGSAAQRQLFFLTMIQAAIKSDQLKLALSLITELKVSVDLAFVLSAYVAEIFE